MYWTCSLLGASVFVSKESNSNVGTATKYLYSWSGFNGHPCQSVIRWLKWAVYDGSWIPVPVWAPFSRLQYDLKIQYNILIINPWSCLKSAELGHSASTSYRARPKFEKKSWPFIYDWLTVNSIKWLNWAIFVSTKTGARKRQYHQCVVYDKIWNILT